MVATPSRDATPREGVDVSLEEQPAKEKFGKCPVDAQLTEEAVQRTWANEYLCEDEYGVGVGDPSLGWWSNNWVNTPGMGPGPDREKEDQESRAHPAK